MLFRLRSHQQIEKKDDILGDVAPANWNMSCLPGRLQLWLCPVILSFTQASFAIFESFHIWFQPSIYVAVDPSHALEPHPCRTHLLIVVVVVPRSFENPRVTAVLNTLLSMRMSVHVRVFTPPPPPGLFSALLHLFQRVHVQVPREVVGASEEGRRQ